MSNKFKAVRITFLGKPLHQVYPHASRFQVIKFKFFKAVRWLLIRTGIAVAATVVLFGVYMYGQLTTPNLVAINNIVAAPVEKSIAPVMERIFKAESGGSHISPVTGQVVYNINRNGKSCKECTLDIGLAQINVDVWGKTATKLGYDLTKEEDNKAFALYIYENYGTDPWYSSAKNW
jgi:hypothetical protein